MRLQSVNLAAPWVRPAIYVALALLAFFSLRAFGSDIKEFFLGDPEVIRANAEAVTQAERAEGVSEAAQGSMEVVVKVREEHVAIDATTQRNDYAIKNATGAGDQAPGVGAALDRALCLRDAYRRQPDCLALQGAGGGERAP